MVRQNNNDPFSQRQLRVGEMIKQALGMIFLRDEAKLPNLETREITDSLSTSVNAFFILVLYF